MDENLLDDAFVQEIMPRRRDLLPIWMRVFTWIFLIFGVLIPPVFLFGMLGGHANLSLYGLSTSQPASLLGVTIMLLFVFKGVVAYGLWTEKEWAVKLALVDALIGIAICTFVMIGLPLLGSGGLNIRLELVALIPYFLKMREIRTEWQSRIALKKEG